MLIEGASDYKALFTPVPVKVVTNDGKPVEVERLKLNPELIGDYSQPYYSKEHVTICNLKSTNRSGKITFASPRTLLNWARSAAQEFR